jgi:hypothetical protein
MLAAALWLGSWLRGTVAPDDLLDALSTLAPGSSPDGLLAEVRLAGTDRTWLVLPRPGMSLGWPAPLAGPPEPAVLLTAAGGTGVVVRAGPGRWSVSPEVAVDALALEATALTARQARRAFETALAESAVRLERLGLDRAPASARDRDWQRALAAGPSFLDPEVGEILHRAAVVLDALALALADDGAAVTSGEARARSGEIRYLAGRVEDLVAGVIGGLNPRPVA